MVPDLTTPQKQAIKADIAANVNTVLINGIATQIKLVPVSPDNAQQVANWYNLQASPSFFGNYATVPVVTIKKAIAWKKLTSAAAIPAITGVNGTDQVAMLHYQNLQESCQALVLNIQTLLGLSSDGVFDATDTQLRQGLQDATSAVPSKSDGTTQDAGWTAAQQVICRLVTNAEKLLATPSPGNGGSNTTAATCTAEGALTGSDVMAIWAS